MKKCIMILFVMCCLFAANAVFSAEVNVEPNVPDALFNAIENAADGDVLILADGGVYPNSEQMSIATHMTIKTADGAVAKAKLVKIPKADGQYSGTMIRANASLELRNIIANGQQGTIAPYSSVFIRGGTVGEGKLHLNGVEVSRFTFVCGGGDVDTVIVENSFFNGNLSVAGGWGCTFDFQNENVKYIRIQNNTYMYCPFGPLLGNGWGDYAAPSRQISQVIIDHNTMYNITGAHGPTTMFSRAENVQFTNNLYVNGTMRPNEFFSDKYMDFPQNEDDITDFVDVISELGPKGMWLISVEMTDTAGTVMDMQANNIVYTSEIEDAWAARGLEKPYTYTNETERVIIDPENSHFEEKVTFTNAPATPMFAVNAIADYCVLGNADPTTYAGETPFQGWDWFSGLEATFDLREKSEIDMTYNTDAASYTAGTDGKPLGDLNWWGLTPVEKPSFKAAEFELSQNYPNPFNPTTEISYVLNKNGQVHLTIYNMLGEAVKTLVNESQVAGSYSYHVDASDLSSGIYFYTLKTGNQVVTKKMTLLK